MEDYRGRVALITGATRGTGKMIAEHFLANGAFVVGMARGETTLRSETYLHLRVDLSEPAAISSAFAALRKNVESIDIVVNNAAVLTSQYALVLPSAAAQAMVNINLLAPFLIAREAAKWMKKKHWGRIIQIGSMAAVLERPGDTVYAACKAGVVTLANIMAREFSPFNITCNTLGISAFASDMLAQLPPDRINAVVAGLPLPRYAEADDILNVIDFFASDRSSGITAQTVYLGGVH